MKKFKSVRRLRQNTGIVLFACMALVISQGCATIAGGSKYYAHVVVEGHPAAAITYEGMTKGYGSAVLKVPRKEANKLVVTVSEKGCPTVQKQFTQRKFRGWAFVGTLVTFTGLTVNGMWLPIPFGVMLDGATGAWWKPDVEEMGVSKTDFKNFNYVIRYNECEQPSPSPLSQIKSEGTIPTVVSAAPSHENSN